MLLFYITITSKVVLVYVVVEFVPYSFYAFDKVFPFVLDVSKIHGFRWLGIYTDLCIVYFGEESPPVVVHCMICSWKMNKHILLPDHFWINLIYWLGLSTWFMNDLVCIKFSLVLHAFKSEVFFFSYSNVVSVRNLEVFVLGTSSLFTVRLVQNTLASWIQVLYTWLNIK